MTLKLYFCRMIIQKPKGTYDLLPEKAFQRNFIENRLRKVFSDFNYSEIRTPTFEKTALFKRGIGEETDIVSKEMYTFNENEFTLKPEMTASVVRAYLENSLYNESPLKKLFYICNMFRRERPQAGRFREFSQFGAEAIGSSDYLIDVEMIVLADTILNNFGIKDTVIRINTIGSLSEREIYLKELKKYLSAYEKELSGDSRKRLIKNPLRILDSKDKTDIEILKNAPLLFDYLKADTKIFFESILTNLKMLNINYEVDYKLVRGLDYYTSTTFEFMSDSLGAQNTLIGGGRYDVLVEQLGGKPSAAIGFAAGMERLEMILEAKKYKFPSEERIKLYIVTMDEKCKILAFGILNELRNSGIKCETDYLNRSVKSQMKEANKTDAEFVIVIGENEIKENKAKLKKMSNGTETEVTDLKNIKDYLI